MGPRPLSPDWYDRLSGVQAGCYYPWSSTVAPDNGKDAYLHLLDEHLGPDKAVLDAGCGHGKVALDIAPHCREVVAYNRVESYIPMAREAARKREVTSISFLLADSPAQANDGRLRIPVRDGLFDLLVSRRGPLHWIEDAWRVTKPGAVLLQLNPVET